MMQFVRFIAAFIIYAVIDIAWNFSPIAMGMYARFHEASGSPLADIQREALDSIAFLFAGIVFFALIAYANCRFAIEPAIRERSIRLAAVNSAVLGCAAYATYIVPVFLIIRDWPGALVPIDIIIGGLLSLITSTIVAAVALRLRKD